MTNKDWNAEKAKSASKALNAIYLWAGGMHTFNKIYRDS